ncbi:MAG: BCCT family transporter [Myxococcota bacterium]
MFFGVAEPVMHCASPPSAAVGSPLAAQQAMTITFFHWGLHRLFGTPESAAVQVVLIALITAGGRLPSFSAWIRASGVCPS